MKVQQHRKSNMIRTAPPPFSTLIYDKLLLLFLSTNRIQHQLQQQEHDHRNWNQNRNFFDIQQQQQQQHPHHHHHQHHRSSKHCYYYCYIYKNEIMFCILIFFMFFIMQTTPMKENFSPSATNHHGHHDYYSSIKDKRWSSSSSLSPLVPTLRTKFWTASSIYPCLDTFDVRISWEVHRVDDIRWARIKPQTNNDNNNNNNNNNNNKKKKKKNDNRNNQQDPNTNNNDLDNNNNNNNHHHSIRHLIRLYWADQDSVDKILSAANKHNNRWWWRYHWSQQIDPRILALNQPNHSTRTNLYSRNSSTNPNNNNNNNNNNTARIRNKFGDGGVNFFHLHSTRPSTLIEMRKLHYVREYSVNAVDTIINQTDGHSRNSAIHQDTGVVSIRCDIFKPIENIFYCFVYLILYKSAVLYENVPHCVPTIAFITDNNNNNYYINNDMNGTTNKNSAQNSYNVGVGVGPSPIRPNIKAVGFDALHSNDSMNDIKFNYNDDDNHNDSNRKQWDWSKPLSTERWPSLSLLSNHTQTDEPNRTTNMTTPKPMLMQTQQKKMFYHGPAYKSLKQKLENHSMSTSIINETTPTAKNATARTVDRNFMNNPSENMSEHLGTKFENFKQQNSFDYDVPSSFPRHIVHTQACSCLDSDKEIEKSLKFNIGQENQEHIETIILRLMITACNKRDNDELGYDPPKSIIRDQYFIENFISMPDPGNDSVRRETRQNDTVEFATQNLRERKHSKNLVEERKNRKQQKKKKTNKINATATVNVVKDPSIRIVGNNNNSEKNREKILTAATDPDGDGGLKNSDIDPGEKMDADFPATNNPTVCILTIENPEQYLFRLDSIEPSIEWLSENPSLGTPYHHHRYFGEEIKPIDYFHKYPFLVVRNGRYSIDPRMNIENRTQNHYLQSKHLRLETLTTMNITLKFKRRISFDGQLQNDYQPRIAGQDNLTEYVLANVLGTMVSWLKNVVANIGLKMFALKMNGGTMMAQNQGHHYHNGDNNGFFPNESMINLPTFYLVSIIMSIFIVLTFMIYAIIAFCDHKNHNHNEIIINNENDSNDFSHETSTTEPQLFNNSNPNKRNVESATNKNRINNNANNNRKQKNKKNDDDDDDDNLLYSNNKMNLIVTCNQQQPQRTSIQCDQLSSLKDRQCSELDFHDYQQQPLMTTNTINVAQSTNKFNNHTEGFRSCEDQQPESEPNQSIIQFNPKTLRFDCLTVKGTGGQDNFRSFNTLPIGKSVNSFDVHNQHLHSTFLSRINTDTNGSGHLPTSTSGLDRPTPPTIHQVNSAAGKPSSVLLTTFVTNNINFDKI